MALTDGKLLAASKQRDSGITILATIVTIVVALVIYRMVYNCYFHPLSRFPGPRLATITSLHLAYLDFAANGSVIQVLRNLHDKYGKAIVHPRIYTY
jgi:hypothetical protein